MVRSYYVYILSSETGTLYTGVTNDLIRRMIEHRERKIEGFTKRYKVHRLIYYAETTDVYAAIEEEKRIKGMSRKRKIQLVRSANPTFRDLWEDLN
jgi:putative endonuclease